MRVPLFLVGAGLTTTLLHHARGHGYMMFPVPRNSYFSNYCPHCANGGGACGGDGGQWGVANADVTLGPTFAQKRTLLYSGGVLEIAMGITAAHMGVFEVQLCANPGSRITESCFVGLERDPSDERYAPYISEAPTLAYMLENTCMAQSTPSRTQVTYRFRVPSGISAEHAIVRWFWQTGNSCAPNPSIERLPVVQNFRTTFAGLTCRIGTTSAGACGDGVRCPNANCRFEQFRNCADVKIVAGSGTVTRSNHKIIEGMPSGNGGGGGSGDNGGGGGGNGGDSGNDGTGGSDGNGGGSDNGNGDGGSGGGDIITSTSTPKTVTSTPKTTTEKTTPPAGGGGDSGNGGGGGGGSTGGCLTDTTDCVAKIRGVQGPWHDQHCRDRCTLVTDSSQALHQICRARNLCSTLDCVAEVEPACTK